MEKKGLVQAAIIAVILIFLFAFLFESPLTAFVVFVILAAVSLLQKGSESGVRMKKVVIYLFMFLLTMGITMANNHFAKQSAAGIIAAAESYMQKRGTYPGQLSDLVPEYLPKVPAAKYTLYANDFKYIAREKQHTLIYVKKPPYGKAYYILEEKKWGMSD